MKRIKPVVLCHYEVCVGFEPLPCLPSGVLSEFGLADGFAFRDGFASARGTPLRTACANRVYRVHTVHGIPRVVGIASPSYYLCHPINCHPIPSISLSQPLASRASPLGRQGLQDEGMGKHVHLGWVHPSLHPTLCEVHHGV